MKASGRPERGYRPGVALARAREYRLYDRLYGRAPPVPVIMPRGGCAPHRRQPAPRRMRGRRGRFTSGVSAALEYGGYMIDGRLWGIVERRMRRT